MASNGEHRRLIHPFIPPFPLPLIPALPILNRPLIPSSPDPRGTVLGRAPEEAAEETGPPTGPREAYHLVAHS